MKCIACNTEMNLTQTKGKTLILNKFKCPCCGRIKLETVITNGKKMIHASYSIDGVTCVISCYDSKWLVAHMKEMMLRCDLHEVNIDRRGCPWCEIEQLREHFDSCNEARKNAESNMEPIKQLSYQMGRNSLKNELIDWLNNGFEYENSVMTVHAVRETIQRFTLADRP